jgi:alpha-tubulin suppressor-like RCC1 family protein
MARHSLVLTSRLGVAALAVAVGGAAAAWTAAAQTSPLVLQSVSAGAHHACGVTADHAAYCWGRNAEGQLGNPAATAPCPEGGGSCSTLPVRVTGSLAVASISAGDNYTCALTTSGVAYCWGDNTYGQLGNGTQTSSPRPARVAISGVRFASISAGDLHTCAVTAAGAAYCWGSNAGGALGLGGRPGGGRTAPGPVATRLRLTAISAGHFHSCALARDGRAYCWGRNEMGEVGNAASAPASSPVAVAGTRSFREVQAAAQFDYSCGVDADGAVYCWGANCYGQLGTDSTSEQCGSPAMPCTTTPVPALAPSTFASVTVGFSHACGLATSGALSCWGDNNEGQLGNGTTGGRTSTPTPIADTLAYRAVSAGRQFTCAVARDGAPMCWGRNAEGQLGTGDVRRRDTPTPVIGPR